jgi:hypothetical protein
VTLCTEKFVIVQKPSPYSSLRKMSVLWSMWNVPTIETWKKQQEKVIALMKVWREVTYTTTFVLPIENTDIFFAEDKENEEPTLQLLMEPTLIVQPPQQVELVLAVPEQQQLVVAPQDELLNLSLDFLQWEDNSALAVQSPAKRKDGVFHVPEFIARFAQPIPKSNRGRPKKREGEEQDEKTMQRRRSVQRHRENQNRILACGRHAIDLVQQARDILQRDTITDNERQNMLMVLLFPECLPQTTAPFAINDNQFEFLQTSSKTSTTTTPALPAPLQEKQSSVPASLPFDSMNDFLSELNFIPKTKVSKNPSDSGVKRKRGRPSKKELESRKRNEKSEEGGEEEDENENGWEYEEL